MIRIGTLLLVVLPLAAIGCASITSDCNRSNARLAPVAETRSDEDAGDQKDGNHKGDSNKDNKAAKTLLEWAIPTTGRGEEKEANGGEKANVNGDEQEKRLEPDRPHLPEAASTVGRGRVVLESGYTYTSNGPAFLHQHSYPEALLRVGMFADWFELRIAQNFINQKDTAEPGQPATVNGAQDLTLGVKLGLTEQKAFLPETALILQTTVPSGAREVSNDTVLPGANLDMGWEIIKDCFGMEVLISANGARDDARHTYVNYVQGITGVLSLTSKLESFTEYDLFVPIGAVSPEATHSQHYVVSGFVYFLTNNLEVDIRAGVGLNNHANDYLVGTGFAVRY